MSLTFGSTSAPSNITTYLDSLFALSLANYRKTMVDNIGSSNPFLNKLLKANYYEPADGGTYIAENLMYALATMDSYDGYDELGDTPTDGISQAQFEWRQLAAPIMYSMKEVIQNQHKLDDLVKARIMQTEMGIQEGWATQFFQGAGNGALATPRTSAINGSSGIDPIGKMIQFDPTVTSLVGNIDQGTNVWWRNRTKTSAASTYAAFLFEMNNLYNTCALGTGGEPDLIITDQTTQELFAFAYFDKYRVLNEDPKFPFANYKFRNAVVVMDEKMPDVYSGTTSAATYGSMYMLNTKFFRVRYHPERDFEMLKDENGKTFAKPLKGDSRIGHISWMGNITINNRRKHGVLGKIARTLTVS